MVRATFSQSSLPSCCAIPVPTPLVSWASISAKGLSVFSRTRPAVVPDTTACPYCCVTNLANSSGGMARITLAMRWMIGNATAVPTTSSVARCSTCNEPLGASSAPSGGERMMPANRRRSFPSRGIRGNGSRPCRMRSAFAGSI